MGYGDYDGFDDDLDDEQNQGPAALRQARKAAIKHAKELEGQVAKLSEQLAKRNLKDALEDKGLRPGLARTLETEKVDVTDPDAIDAWLNDPANQENFGFSVKVADEASPSNDAGDAAGESSEEEDPSVADLAAQYRAMQDASNGALPPNKYVEAEAQILKAETPEQIQAALDSALANLPKTK